MSELRRTGLPLAVALSAAWLATRFTSVEPIADWLLPRLLATGACAALLGLACVAAGDRALRWLAPDEPFDGALAVSFTIGLLLFFLLVFLGGLLHLFGAGFFFAAPAVLLALGLWRRTGPSPFSVPWTAPASRFELAILLAGALAAVAAALPVLAPDNLSFDARWYHLALGEQYAVAGGFVNFREGLMQASVSHLASWLDAWAFQLPGGLLDRLLLTRWLELLALAATLAGVPALARALGPEAGPQRLAWVAFFLFPSIFVYDTALLGGADHLCAAFAIPAWLALLHFWKKPCVRSGVLVALPVAGLALSKYTAVILVVPLAVAVVVRVARALRAPAERRAAALGLAACAGAGLVLTAPHWLTNTVLHGSPLYPALCGQLACSPWTPAAGAWVTRYVSEAVDLAQTPLSAGGAVRALFDYSWGRYTFEDFHGLRPVFGSLFTASLPALLFLTGTRRLSALVLAVHASLLLWYLLAHQERYLLPLVPLMAGGVAATLALAWRQGSRVVRICLVLLVAVQVAGAADAPFLPTHRAHGESPLGRAVQFLGAGFKHARAEHLRDFLAFEAIGAALPADALVLMHRNFIHLGIGRRVMTDNVPHTLGLDYATLGSVAAVREQLAALGVTHVAVADAPDQDSLAAELLFRAFVALGTRPMTAVSGWRLSSLEPRVAAEPAPWVLVAGCGQPLADGLYRLSDLGAPLPAAGLSPQMPSPSEAGPAAALLERAGYVVVEPSCAPPLELAAFQSLGPLAGASLFVRR